MSAVLLVCCTTALAAADRPTRDIAYSNVGGRATTLDVYAPREGTGHPVLIWIHGGGWRLGDKANVQLKPSAFNERGFVFVSINYRLHPDVTYQEQGADVARAVRWVRDHARDYGGSPERIFLLGHSAGAHLAALVATDHRYLEAERMKLGDLSGVVLLDGAGYDIPRQLELARLPRAKELYRTVFGDDRAKQQDASPLTHVAAGKNIPPFLILYVAQRPDSKVQSQTLAEKLRAAGTAADVIAAQDKTHATINRDLGAPADPPTQSVFAFLTRHAAP